MPKIESAGEGCGRSGGRPMKWLERAQAWFAEHPNVEALLWFVVAVACIAILAWFLMFSGYGDPPEFVYEQF